MYKFWAWMTDKKYSYGTGNIFDNNGLESEPTEQMLIGYMFEYLMERYDSVDMLDISLCNGNNIYDFYESLKKNI